MKCQGCLFPPLAVRRPASTICRTIGSGIGVSLKRRTASTVRIASNVSMESTSFLDALMPLILPYVQMTTERSAVVATTVADLHATWYYYATARYPEEIVSP